MSLPTQGYTRWVVTLTLTKESKATLEATPEANPKATVVVSSV